MSTAPRFAWFIHVKTTEAWLRLPRSERREVAGACLGAAVAGAGALSIRHFDAEAFTAECTDVLLVETGSPLAYYDFMERLRDSALITEPYFQIVRIVPAVEDGFRGFEERAGTTAMAG
jgi:hypothetical protein